MTEMFPTKSRLQVAIAIEKLLHALEDVHENRTLCLVHGIEVEARYWAALDILIQARLQRLIRPVLFAPAYQSYNPRLNTGVLSLVRGRAREFRL